MQLSLPIHNEKPTINLLPYDGIVLYVGKIIEQQQAADYFEQLFQAITWKHDEALIYGKRITTKRKVAWYADHAFSYTYSKTTKYALPWTPELLTLKMLVESLTGEVFNSCLLNLYHDGNEGMTWHSDAERELKKHGAIASLSFGAQRKFAFKHKETKEKIELVLEDGSLLLMKGVTQDYWLHCLAPSKRITTPRINLTFRQIEATLI